MTLGLRAVLMTEDPGRAGTVGNIPFPNAIFRSWLRWKGEGEKLRDPLLPDVVKLVNRNAFQITFGLRSILDFFSIDELLTHKAAKFLEDYRRSLDTLIDLRSSHQSVSVNSEPSV